MDDKDIADLRAAIAALEGQRATLGDTVLELATAPLRARLAGLLRPAGRQHRQVAVLFVDVVGSTAMAQALEAEDTLDLLGGALRRMADIVQAHQGRVLRFTGDGSPLSLSNVLPAGLGAPLGLEVEGSGATPVYDSGRHELTWSGTPPNGQQVIIRYTSPIATDVPALLRNTASLFGTDWKMTATAAILANPNPLFLPVITRDG